MADAPTFPQELAAICFAAADLVLDPIAQPSDRDAKPEPQWVFERRVWAEQHGTEEPMEWVAHSTSVYVIEAAHQVRAIGVLLIAGTVTASLDPLVRAVVERVGRVKWILSPDIHPTERGARAGLEFGVSMSSYRMALERLGAPGDAQKEWQKRVRAHRDRLETLFVVEKPPSDPCDPESKPTPDISRWVVGGERYPNYVANAGFALEAQSMAHATGKATYDGLSGFSHPSVVFSREHRTIADDGRVTYTYQPSDLEKSVRLAAFGLLDAFRYWASYYGAAPDAVQRRVDELGDRMDGISVIEDQPPEM